MLKYKFTEVEKKLLLELMGDNDNTTDIFKHSMGKLVKIIYSEPKAREKYGGNYPLAVTFGVVVNICMPKIYIVNRSGCQEIIKISDIEQMIEIDFR